MTRNPFADFDLTKMMGQFKMPGIDANAMVRAGRKNMEALVAANQLAAEGLQTVARRQAEIMRENVENATAAMRETGGQAGDVHRMQAWAGQAAALARAEPAGEVVRRLWAEAEALLS